MAEASAAEKETCPQGPHTAVFGESTRGESVSGGEKASECRAQNSQAPARSPVAGIRLHSACKTGRLHTVHELLSSGRFCDIEFRDGQARTALFVASLKGHASVVERLLAAGADPEVKDDCGQTSLFCASQHGHQYVVDLLLSSGHCRDLEARDSEYGMTALCAAAWNGHANVIRRLRAAGADIQAKDKYGLQGLSAASWKGHLPVVEYLLDAGADIDAKDNSDQTALCLASRRGCASVVKQLLAAGASPDVTNNAGETALLAAASKHHPHTAQLLLWSGRCHNLEARGDRGRTALHFAAWHAEEHLVEHLLFAGADAKAKTTAGRTALEIAGWGVRMPYRDAAIVRRLLEEAVDIGSARFRADRLWPFRAVITCWRVAVNYHDAE